VTEPVALESILPCLQGVIPSPFATCAADGTPNITYLSIVHYVDSERVALSRQFFNKTRANLDANRFSQVRVVDPTSIQEYAIDLEYLHTESAGPTFEAMKANLEAIASQSGHSELFRLRGVDIHRAVRCAPASQAGAIPGRPSERDVIARLDEYTRRLARATAYDDAARCGLEALDDLFDFTQAILLVADERGDRLFAIADNGYPTSAAGGEVAFGVGVVGIAAQRRQVVCVPNLTRSRVMQTAVSSSVASTAPEREIPLPGLADSHSVAAIPLLARDRLLGVLYLESTSPGHFGPHNERTLRVLAGHLAAVLGGLGDASEPPDDQVDEPARAAPAVAATRSTAAVTYYQADDSVFVDEGYVIKGVPGRILWRLLSEHVAHRRETFSNRELRLDESLGLPVGNDNLEARLLVLRKRLAAGDFGMRLERVGRGRLLFQLDRPVVLREVPTSGPMRVAHDPDRAG
jgi:adenylate cyclase